MEVGTWQPFPRTQVTKRTGYPCPTGLSAPGSHFSLGKNFPAWPHIHLAGFVEGGRWPWPQVWELGPYLALASSFRIHGLDGGSHGDSCCDFSKSAPQIERTDPEGLELVSGEGRHEWGSPSFLFPSLPFPPLPSSPGCQEQQANFALLSQPSPLTSPGLSHTQQHLVSPKVLVSLCQ